MFQIDGELASSLYPSKSMIEKLKRHKLVAVRSSDNSPLHLSNTWSTERLDKTIRKLLPQPMQWLDIVNPCSDGELQWRLVGKDKLKAYLVEEENPTGDTAYRFRNGGSGCAYQEMQVCLGKLDCPVSFTASHHLQFPRFRYLKQSILIGMLP